MSTFRGLWVDDIRPLPADLHGENWCIAKSFHEAIVKLELIEFEEVSLDHDIASFYGNKEMTGYDVLMWLVSRKLDGLSVPSIIRVHSANPIGRGRMIEMIQRYFPLK